MYHSYMLIPGSWNVLYSLVNFVCPGSFTTLNHFVGDTSSSICLSVINGLLKKLNSKFFCV